MDKDLDQALEVDVLAASLRMDDQETGDLLEFLAVKLVAALPSHTTVTRRQGFFSSHRPVETIQVQFDDLRYQLERQPRGGPRATIAKSVRGVVLKTTQVGVDQWTEALAESIAQLAHTSAATRRALNRFVLGS